MKPLNQKVRSSAIIKFIAANVLALSLMGYSLYSYVFVNKNITTEVEVDTNEVKTLETFMLTADKHITSFANANNETDRSKFSLELNKLILENRDKFHTNAIVFDKISERYKSNLRTQEKLSKVQSSAGKVCESQIKEIEDEMEKLKDNNLQLKEDLKDKVNEGNQGAREVKMVKSSINRIASDLMTVAADINAKDWCPGIASGNGRSEIKSELKQRISSLRNELLNQAGQLQ